MESTSAFGFLSLSGGYLLTGLLANSATVQRGFDCPRRPRREMMRVPPTKSFQGTVFHPSSDIVSHLHLPDDHVGIGHGFAHHVGR